jgi:hypothetical protein
MTPTTALSGDSRDAPAYAPRACGHDDPLQATPRTSVRNRRTAQPRRGRLAEVLEMRSRFVRFAPDKPAQSAMLAADPQPKLIALGIAVGVLVELEKTLARLRRECVFGDTFATVRPCYNGGGSNGRTT